MTDVLFDLVKKYIRVGNVVLEGNGEDEDDGGIDIHSGHIRINKSYSKPSQFRTLLHEAFHMHPDHIFPGTFYSLGQPRIIGMKGGVISMEIENQIESMVDYVVENRPDIVNYVDLKLDEIISDDLEKSLVICDYENYPKFRKEFDEIKMDDGVLFDFIKDYDVYLVDLKENDVLGGPGYVYSDGHIIINEALPRSIRFRTLLHGMLHMPPDSLSDPRRIISMDLESQIESMVNHIIKHKPDIVEYVDQKLDEIEERLF